MIQSKKKGDCLTVCLKGEIDHCAADALRRETESLIRSERIRRLHLDFSQVSFIDSSGIGFVIGRYKTMKALGGELTASGMNTIVYQLFRLAGLHRIISVQDDGGKVKYE